MDENTIVNRALKILEARAKYGSDVMSNPESVRSYLRLKLGESINEEFWAIWLDAQNRVIEIEKLFTGTLTQTPIFPRTIVRKALDHNAAAVIFAHNHPSGTDLPSNADIKLTRDLKEILDKIDTRVMDHLIITALSIKSLAELGYM